MRNINASLLVLLYRSLPRSVTSLPAEVTKYVTLWWRHKRMLKRGYIVTLSQNVAGEELNGWYRGMVEPLAELQRFKILCLMHVIVKQRASLGSDSR